MWTEFDPYDRETWPEPPVLVHWVADTWRGEATWEETDVWYECEFTNHIGDPRTPHRWRTWWAAIPAPPDERSLDGVQSPFDRQVQDSATITGVYRRWPKPQGGIDIHRAPIDCFRESASGIVLTRGYAVEVLETGPRVTDTYDPLGCACVKWMKIRGPAILVDSLVNRFSR